MTSPLLVAALCFGQRCAGLHRLDGERARRGSCPPAEGPPAEGPPESPAPDPSSLGLVRLAVARSARAVLIQTRCLGPCADGCIGAFGQARMPQPGTIAWVAPPMIVGGLQDRVQAQAAAEWIRARAHAAQRS